MAAARLQNRVLDLWWSKRPAVTAWLCVGNAFTAEAMARQGFDACLVDCQVRASRAWMGVRMGLGMGRCDDVRPRVPGLVDSNACPPSIGTAH